MTLDSPRCSRDLDNAPGRLPTHSALVDDAHPAGSSAPIAAKPVLSVRFGRLGRSTALGRTETDADTSSTAASIHSGRSGRPPERRHRSNTRPLEKDGQLLLTGRTRLSDHSARTSVPLSVPLLQPRASDRSPLYCRPSSRQVERLPRYRTRQTAMRFELVGHRLSGPVSIRTAKGRSLEHRYRSLLSPS